MTPLATRSIQAGDTLYVPQNTVHQYFSGSDTEPLRLLSAQNRGFRWLGYDKVAYLEDAGIATAVSGLSPKDGRPPTVLVGDLPEVAARMLAKRCPLPT